MRVSEDSDYQNENEAQIKPIRQLYAALLLRAITDINAGTPPTTPVSKGSRKYVRKDDNNDISFIGSAYETAMMWVFNEKDYNNPPNVLFSTCCEVLSIDPVLIQKHCALLVLQNKTPDNRDKTVTRGELHVDTRVFKLLI